MVVTVVKMRYRCTYAHLKGTWGSGDRAPFICSLSVNTGEWSATSTGCFAPRTRGPFPTNRRLGGPQKNSGYFGKEKNLVPCQQSNHNFSSAKSLSLTIMLSRFLMMMIINTQNGCAYFVWANAIVGKTLFLTL